MSARYAAAAAARKPGDAENEAQGAVLPVFIECMIESRPAFPNWLQALALRLLGRVGTGRVIVQRSSSNRMA